MKIGEKVNLGNFGQVRAILGKFVQVWASLGKFGKLGQGNKLEKWKKGNKNFSG